MAMWTEADRETYKDDGRRYPSDLTEAEWATIAPLLSGYDPLTADLRAMVDACLYLDKTGCPWRYLPKDFGAWETVRTWHDRFRADGIWSEIGGLLTRAVRRERGRQPEPSTAILDSQSVTSGPQAGSRGYDGKQDDKRHQAPWADLLARLRLGEPGHAANGHDTQAAGLLFDRAVQNGWVLERVKVDGIYVGPRMAQAAAPHDLDVQVTTVRRH